MSKKKFLLNILSVLFFFVIGQSVFAQSTGTGSLHFEQKLQWQSDKNAFEYKVEVKPVSGGSSTFVTTSNTSVTVNLGAGEYQYRVYTVDFLGRESSVSEWRKFSVVKAVAPEIAETPKQVAAAVDTNKKIDVPIEVRNIEEDSVVELINTETNQVVKGTLKTQKTDGEVVAASAEFSKLSEGDWKLKVTNPSGLSSESSTIVVADAAKILKEEKAAEKQAEAERKTEEKRLAEEAKNAEAERKAEEKRLAEEAKLADAERKAEEKRVAEEAKLAEAEEKKRQAEEAKRLAEEAKKAEAERKAEEKRLAEEAKKAEEQRKIDEAAERKRLAQEEVQARKDAAAQRAKEAEEKRLADEKARKERQAEMKRQAQERAALAKEREEKAKVAEQLHKENQKLLEEQERLAKAEEEKRQKEEEIAKAKAEKAEKRANRKFFDLNMQAGILSNSNVINIEDSLYNNVSHYSPLTPVELKLTYLPIDVMNMKFGFEVAGIFDAFHHKEQQKNIKIDSKQQIYDLDLNVVGQFPIINNHLYIRARLGGGISIIKMEVTYSGPNSENRNKNGATSYGYLNAQAEAGLYWQITRFVIMEAGTKFDTKFIKDMPSPMLSAYLTGGIRL